MGHGAAQVEYLDWKASLFGNIAQSRTTNAKGAVFVDLTPLPELAEVRQAVYWGDGRKHLTYDYLKALTPLALAVWYMDDGSFSVRAQGLQERTREGSGRSEICVQALSPGSQQRLLEHLAGAFDLHPTLSLRGARQQAVLSFAKDETAKLHELVAPYVHPTMQYKLLERFRGRFAVEPAFVAPTQLPVPAPVLEVKVKPKGRSMHRFDIEVEGSHNYLADGVLVHNSPETTTGGKALKFYASVRIDVRRIETLKDGTDAVGNRTRAKIVKNKVSPPFKQAEFDIIYGVGISREGSLVDMGVEHGIVRKSGAWYTYEGDQLGQGKENARAFLRDNPDLADEIEKRVKEKLGVGPVVDADQPAPVPVDL
jgi:recombination protein RecA